MSVAAPLTERLTSVADRRRIAIVTLRGVIGGSVRTAELLRTLDSVRRNQRFHAVLLDIDSPGGAAIESEAIYIGIKRLAAAKPVVAWIRSTGASGAYFAACGATRILAFPAAVVGSIGVISIRPVLVEALRRIGTQVLVTKTGPFKDLGAPWREPTEAERAKEQELVDAVFVRFTRAVSGARRFDENALARVTTGEVWLAETAMNLGLVDGLAETEDDALIEAQQLAGLPRREVIRLGPRRTILQKLGMPGAGMGPPSSRWLIEIDGWLRAPQLRA